MKICLINNLYSNQHKAGAENIVSLSSLGFKRNGHEVFLIATETKYIVRDEKVYYLTSIFSKLNHLPLYIRLFWHWWDALNVINYFKVKRILSNEKPDVVIVHNLKGLGLLLPSAIRKSKSKYIQVLHDLQMIYPSGLLIHGQEKVLSMPWAIVYQYLSRKLIKSPDYIVSPSEWLINLHQERRFFVNSKIKTIRNPVEIVNDYQSVAKKNVYRFLFVGQFNKAKGAKFLIEAFINLNDNIKGEIELVLIGYGEEKNKVAALCKNHRNIIIPNSLDHEMVLREMNKSDCLIVPSLCYENSPTVIYEAASRGLPVIASRIGGATELIHELGGLLFEPGNKKDLIKKIEWALMNKEEMKIIGQTAKNRVGEYSISKYIKKIERLL
ncbi:glycosyltransferase [Candidatus Parcubacteria bacterium]|nr:glycosyltransferase [Candidatus Parcubacteria bacterium]